VSHSPSQRTTTGQAVCIGLLNVLSVCDGGVYTPVGLKFQLESDKEEFCYPYFFCLYGPVSNATEKTATWL